MFVFMSMVILVISFFFVFLVHPLVLGVLLVFQATMISLVMGGLVGTFWFSYLLFLIFVGGLMVLFLYVGSLAGNDLFGYMGFGFVLVFLLGFSLVLEFFFSFGLNSWGGSEVNFILFYISNFYTYFLGVLSICLIFYLLFVLVVVVSNSVLKCGPVRLLV